MKTIKWINRLSFIGMILIIIIGSLRLSSHLELLFVIDIVLAFVGVGTGAYVNAVQKKEIQQRNSRSG